MSYQIQSEIQGKMLAAILAEAKERSTQVNVFTEFKIKSYFADILLVAEGGQKLIIECDGHEYHSSKDDKAYDSDRDRALLEEGFITVRFTGRQIHHRAQSYARWVFDFIEKWPI